MSTIGDLCVTSSVSSDDKLPVWSNANGVTRALPISVLDSRYLRPQDIAALAASQTTETFVAGTDFTPGVSLALTLSNQYFSAQNIEVFFDAAYQGPDQYSLVGLGLVFISPIPVGVQKVYVRGGETRVIGSPSDGTVTDISLAPGTKVYNRANDRVSVTDFGANQTLDASAAFIAAANFCNARGGGTVFIPAGRWKIAATIPSYKNVEFVGDGEYASIVVPTTPSMAVFSCVNVALTITYNAFRDFTIAPSVSGVVGIKLTLCRFAKIENINFAGCAVNVSADRGYFIDLLNLTSEGVTGLPAGALVMTSTDDADYIFHSTISNYKLVNQGTGVPSTGIYLRRAINFQFTDIHAYGATGCTVLLIENDSQAVKVKGLNVAGCAAGILLQQGAGVPVIPTFTSIAASHIDQPSAYGIQLNGASDTSLTDVQVTPTGSFVNIPALFLVNDQKTSVVGCHMFGFSGVGGVGIQLSGTQNATIHSNIIDGCNIGVGYSGTTSGIDNADNKYLNCPNPIGGSPVGTNNRIRPSQQGLAASAAFVPVTPTVPASTVPFTNNTGFTARVTIAGGTFTVVNLNGVAVGVSGNNWTGEVQPGETIAITYSSVPSWWWVGK